MGNPQNLRPPFSPSEARENGAKGGASPKRKATLNTQKLMRKFLTAPPQMNENTKAQLRQLGVNPDSDAEAATNAAMLIAMVLSKAYGGDLGAVKMAFEMSGQAVSVKDLNDRERIALDRERLTFDKQHTVQGSAVAGINPFVQALMNSETAMTLNDADVPEGVTNGADKAEE